MKWRLDSFRTGGAGVPRSRSGERLAWAGILAGLTIAVAAHAELARWIQDIPAPSRLEAIFFRAVALPVGAIEIRRPPKETVAELGKLISTSPSDAELYSLRAREQEQQLDFAAAESDWKKAAQLAPNKIAATLELADFYNRRIRPQDEIAALEAAGKMPAQASERWTPPRQQQSWKAFERILQVIHEQALPGEFSVRAYRAWIARYPAEPGIYAQFLQYLIDAKQFDEAQKTLVDYSRAFPNDGTTPIRITATIAWRRGSLDDAIGIYDQSFRPMWPIELVSSYFQLLKEAHALRRYLEQARNQIATRPTDLAAAARVFYYYQQQGNLAAAQRALFEFRLRKETLKSAWTADELSTLAQLFEGVNNPDEAARGYYALYSLPGAPASAQEKALAALANLLLTAPEQSMRLGSADLSLYGDIAQIDPGPGFLNGILSLLLNSSEPGSHFAADDAASLAYFHRAKAAELVRLFDSRFPASAERAHLQLLLIEAYGTYGDSDAVIRSGREFLSAFPKAFERSAVASAMADAYARQNQVPQEFAIYDDLLKELAAQADGVPIGELSSPAVTLTAENAQTPATRPARSPQYARVLDRYISRLVALKRVRDALALYRREIDRNPNDAGLYERLAAFLEENKMGAEVEQIYRRAMTQFSDRSWSHKLARWYLRQKQTAQFERLTEDVVKIFSGTELEAYLRDAGNGQTLAPILYRQVNLYAHQRFPHNLTFVRNLLTAYAQRGTADPVASEALLRKYWFYSNDLRDRFFELLSRSNKLNAELQALRTTAPANAGTQQLLADATAWQSHFEEAAPLLQSVTADFPADMDRGSRCASLFRSLATYEPAGQIRNTRVAAQIEQNLTRAEPRNTATLARLGEIYADRELFNRAKPSWDRIAKIRPGEPSGYVESATIFWDYFRFNDALRVIGDGRRKLADPALFAYEAGAIYENQRNYQRALAEYAKGAFASETSPARFRLLRLARRARDRDAVERIALREVSVANPAITAVSFRADLLANQRDDLEQFFTALADRTTSLELLVWLEQRAVRDGFDTVQEHCIRRQIAILTDPVELIRERLALARFHEGRQDLEAARNVIAALYKENPAILGVVRAAVDFYWRNKEHTPAIDALLQAASIAQPVYLKQFTFEAARKATEAGEYSRARTLLAALLKDDPYNSEYLAATGDAYAREGNDTGLRDFYSAKLKEIAAAPLAPADRTEKTAALGRGLIPVLTRLKDYSGAVDQYVEIINRYPDDEPLAREAALYASTHGRAPQLAGYYEKRQNDSPKDYRWPMVLARIDTTLEDFPAAIAEYRRAANVRPDRIDLFTGRAALEERLLRFDDAAATYAKLYELNYHNSQWMEKVAEIRARQGRSNEAVEALRKALLEGRPERPEPLFAMAAKLESWGMLAPAREYAEKAVASAGSDLLADFQTGAQLYARVMTRTRVYQAAYRKLLSLVPNQPGQPVSGEVQPALQQIGASVALYYGPEEKQAFADFLGANLTNVPKERIQSLLPMVESAGLSDLDAKWRYQLLTASRGDPPLPLVNLQQRRLRYDQLGSELEAYWRIVPADKENRDALLPQAAENFRLAGTVNSELRVLTQMEQMGALSGNLAMRYAEILFRTPPRFTAVVAAENRSDQLRNAFAAYVLDNGTASRALETIAARGRGLPPVWTRAYSGLVGLYFANPAAEVNAAFRDTLGTASIGERFGKDVDRNLQLAGNTWFYYGSRYGEYLDVTKKSDAEDYLPAELEASPAHADAYFTLAEYYRESGHADRALVDYQNALQLDAKRGDAHDGIALVYWQQNKHDLATTEFRAALDAFLKQENDRRIPENFWRALASTLEDIGKCHLLASVRTEADRVLRTYVRHNGSYQSDLLIRSAIRAAGDPAAGIAWILDISKAAPDQSEFLAYLSRVSWIPDDQRPRLFEGMIQSAKQKLSSTFGEARGYAEAELLNRELEWAEYLVDQKQTQAAERALSSIPEDARKTRVQQVVSLEIRIAQQAGRLKALLDGYAQRPASGFSLDVLQRAATDLEQRGDHAAARQVLEFVYNRQLDSHQFSAATFLGLAEIRLDQGDTKGAVSLLRRMTLVTGEPFEHLSDAADLLIKTKHPADAAQFLSDQVRAAPWDLAAKGKLGRLQASAQTLRDVAESADAPYDARVLAAQSLGELKAGALTTAAAELNLLSSAPPISPAAAEKPYFYHARLSAAAQSNDPAVQIRLLEGAAAVAPNVDDVKLRLFDAAYRAKQYETAIAALHPLLSRHGLLTMEDMQPPIGPGQIAEDQPENSYYAAQFLSTVERGRRATIARQLADCYAKLNRLREAAAYYRIALQLQPSDTESKTQLGAIQSEIQRQRANHQRQPAITANLEQDHPVRPRLRAQGGGQ